MEQLITSVHVILSETNSTYDVFYIMLVLGFWVIIMYVVQIVIHELGHLLFGRLTGYKTIFFRIFHLGIIKIESRWYLKKYHYPGSLGQCIMLPPKTDNKPVILHTMGGIILNIFMAVSVLPIIFSPYSISFIPRAAALIFSFYGIGFALLSGLPIKQKNIVNDGMVTKELYRDPLALDLYYKQLRIASNLVDGLTYENLPYEIIKVPEDADLTNAMIGYHKILECYYYMDKMEWDKAEKLLNEFIDRSGKISNMIDSIINMELLFLSIIKKDEKTMNQIYHKISDVLEKETGDFHVMRVKLSYEIFRNKQKMNKNMILKELDKRAKGYPYKGEAVFCIKLVNEVFNNKIDDSDNY